MIEVRLFATLRNNREKIYFFEAEKFHTVADIMEHLTIQKEEVSTFLVNGFHKSFEEPVKDGDVIALFPPVGGG